MPKDNIADPESALPPVEASTPQDGGPEDTGTVTGEPPKKRRGRPVGSTNKKPGADEKPAKTAARKAMDVDAFANQLVGIHKMIAMVMKLPMMEISPQEGKMLAQGFCAVADEYGIALTGKAGAAIQLFGACAMVYGPRVMLVKAMQAAAAAQARAQEANTMDGTGIINAVATAH